MTRSGYFAQLKVTLGGYSMTYNEELILVQTAISDILQYGQSLSVLSRGLTRASLPSLYDREAFLRRMVARENSTRSWTQGVP